MLDIDSNCQAPKNKRPHSDVERAARICLGYSLGLGTIN